MKLQKEVERSISSDKLADYCGCSFVCYNELKDKNIDTVRLPCIVLYLNTKSYGHYTCLFKNREGINFFDSYGYSPDKEFEFADKKLNYKGKPYMCRLLRDFRGTVIYNEVPLQSSDKKVATCGRWCAVRIRYKELTQDEFVKFVKSLSNRLNLTPDELVTVMTKGL